MIETLMIQGGHRIDYLSEDAAGKPEAFGFYVCGDLGDQEPYSQEAKHHLYAGLNAIQKQLGRENLVAIYVDVNSADTQNRPAYQKMKQDMLDGMFRRVFTFVSDDLIGSCASSKDLLRLYQELEGFEWITCDDGVCHSISGDLPRRLRAESVMCA